jgi:hypothetical protein
LNPWKTVSFPLPAKAMDAVPGNLFLSNPFITNACLTIEGQKAKIQINFAEVPDIIDLRFEVRLHFRPGTSHAPQLTLGEFEMIREQDRSKASVDATTTIERTLFSGYKLTKLADIEIILLQPAPRYYPYLPESTPPSAEYWKALYKKTPQGWS